MSCGSEFAVREFAPSYKRAAIMQASLAAGGLVLGLVAAFEIHDRLVAVGAVLLGVVVPFTLIVILPTNKQLMDSALDPMSARATTLLHRWNRLHAVRSLLSAIAFGLLLCRVAHM